MSQDTTGMEAGSVAEVATTDPDFIVYLLDPEQEYNCYFVVGNPALANTERIGVVKKMLLAHSLVLRAELQDSQIAEKNNVKVIDLFPQTFKNLLRFVYGYDNTETLGFDEADNLLYAAEKYMMPKLKNRLATRLMSLLDCSNICSLMNNPACYTVLELNSAITDILQLETDQVLASPQFLDLSSNGFLKILEQEITNVDEIELWRAAIKWAKLRGESDCGNVIRNELTNHLQHIRVCSMTNEEILMEVNPTQVLTHDELILVGDSLRTGEVQPNLTTICNVIEKRDRPLVKSEMLELDLMTDDWEVYSDPATETTLTLTTGDAAIELCSVQLFRGDTSNHHCNCTISIQRDTEPPVVVRFEGQLEGSATGWNIPVLINRKNVQLSPNSSYSMTCTFSCSYTHCCIYTYHRFVDMDTDIHEDMETDIHEDMETYLSQWSCVSGRHFAVDFQCHSIIGYYLFQVNKIGYKTVTKRVKSSQNTE